MKRGLRGLAGPVLLILAVAAALVILARQGADLLRQPLNLRWSLIITATLLAGFGQLGAAVIWRQIVRTFGIRRALREDMRIYFYSAVSSAIPGSIWVLASRSAFYMRHGESGLRVAAATTLEAFVIGIAGIAVYALTVLVKPGAALWQNPIAGFACAALALVLIQPRIFNGLSRWALRRARQPVEGATTDFSRRQLLAWFAGEMLIIVLAGTVLFVLLNSLVSAPLSVFVQVTAAWAAAVAAGNLLYFLPGTVLLRDGALILALSASLGLPMAVLFAVVSRVWSIAVLLLTAGCTWLILDLPAKLRHACGRPKESAEAPAEDTTSEIAPARLTKTS